jgi:hypothetical protein
MKTTLFWYQNLKHQIEKAYQAYHGQSMYLPRDKLLQKDPVVMG